MTFEARIFNIQRSDVTELSSGTGVLNLEDFCNPITETSQASGLKIIRRICRINRIKTCNTITAEPGFGSIKRQFTCHHCRIALDQVLAVRNNYFGSIQKRIGLNPFFLEKKDTVVVSNPFSGQEDLTMHHPRLHRRLGNNQFFLKA